MGVPTKDKLHLSHSQIGEVLRCPRKYHLHYRLGLPAEFCPSGLLFGSAVHEAIAFFHQMRLEGREASGAQLFDVFQERWGREALPVRLKAGETESSISAKAKKLLEFYVAHPNCAGHVIAVEEPFRLQFCDGLPEVWGVMDLVEGTPEGGLVITDFKTAGSRSEPPADQLVLYREAVRALDYPGSGQVAARYVVLFKGKDPDITVYEPEITPANGESLRKLYESVWQDIELGSSSPRPGWQCAECQWRSHCDQA